MKHGHSTRKGLSPEYTAWAHMLSRCQNSRDCHYPEYAGRGIQVCVRWLDFENFLADMGSRPSLLHSLERLDNDGSYEPGNVEWATQSVQMRNTRANRLATINGETMCVADWSDRLGLKRGTVYGRMFRGMSPEQALLAPVPYGQRCPSDGPTNILKRERLDRVAAEMRNARRRTVASTKLPSSMAGLADLSTKSETSTTHEESSVPDVIDLHRMGAQPGAAKAFLMRRTA